MKWSDIDWAKGFFFVFSPKLAAYPDKATRKVPLFPELRETLTELWESSREGAVYVLPTIRNAEKNLRTHIVRIIRRAGLTVWEKPWQNMRACRATELGADYPSFVAAGWLGHTEQIADEHYRNALNSHFETAANRRTPGESAGLQGDSSQPLNCQAGGPKSRNPDSNPNSNPDCA